jgi:hypothetical protein
MKKTNEGCRGCPNLDPLKRLYICFRLDTGELSSCPCQDCLLKPICNQVCDNYKALIGDLIKYIDT